MFKDLTIQASISNPLMRRRIRMRFFDVHKMLDNYLDYYTEA